MDVVLQEHLKTYISRLSGENFQTFTDFLFTKKYGSSFRVLRHHRDMGCDGIINNKTVIAVYGPENGRNTLSSFKTKFSTDHQKYQENWSKVYPEFLFVYNSSLTGEMVNFVNQSYRDTIIIDENGIFEMIDSLLYSKVFEIVKHLGIPEEYFSVDVLTEVINDLSKNGDEYASVPLVKPIYIEDKILLNYDLSDVESMKEEYYDTLPDIRTIEVILRDYGDGEITALKSKIRTLYSELGGSFKERFNNLSDRLSQRRPRDDIYRSKVRSVLLYMFELCLIGRRTTT